MALYAVITHPKFIHLQKCLGKPLYGTLGCLEALWHFTARYTPAGNIGKYSDEAIEHFIGWDGAGGRLIESLVESHFVEFHSYHRLVLHDWSDNADETVNTILARRCECFWNGVIPRCGRLNAFERPRFREWLKTMGLRTKQGSPQRLYVPSIERSYDSQNDEDSTKFRQTSDKVPTNIRLSSGEVPLNIRLSSGEVPTNIRLSSGEVPLNIRLSSAQHPKPVPVPEPEPGIHARCAAGFPPPPAAPGVVAPESGGEPDEGVDGEVPEGFRPEQYANWVLDQRAIPPGVALLRRMTDAIGLLARVEGCGLGEATRRMEERMRRAEDEGPQKWFLWLEDGGWKEGNGFHLREAL